MRILITGCAGFIGFHLTKKLSISHKLIGIDNLNSYYDVYLKKNRLKILKKLKNFNFIKLDIKNKNKINEIFIKNKIDIVIHLASQAGVRYSIANPRAYLETNIDGFFNLIHCSSENKVKNFIYASSSSIYGDSKNFPLTESEYTDQPISFYGATKKCNEIIAHSFSSIHNLQCTGLRFFTVYGPYGRPDMSLFKFVDNIQKSKKIYLHNYGNHIRDFTYVDDVVESIALLLNRKKNNIKLFEIFNISSSNPIKLLKFVKIIENTLNKKAKISLKSFQKGDVYKTYGDTTQLFKNINYKPRTSIEDGIRFFCEWYKQYYS